MKEAFENIFSQLIESTKHVEIFDVSEVKRDKYFCWALWLGQDFYDHENHP